MSIMQLGLDSASKALGVANTTATLQQQRDDYRRGLEAENEAAKIEMIGKGAGIGMSLGAPKFDPKTGKEVEGSDHRMVGGLLGAGIGLMTGGMFGGI